MRENLADMVDYFMVIFHNELTLGESNPEKIEQILRNMDSRKLLTFIYILKAVMKTLRNHVRNNLEKINNLIINIIHTF